MGTFAARPCLSHLIGPGSLHIGLQYVTLVFYYVAMSVGEVSDALRLYLLFDCGHASALLGPLFYDAHVLLVEMPSFLKEQTALLLIRHFQTLLDLAQHV